MSTSSIPFSVLDLVPVTQGATPREALRRSLDLVRHAERLGYRRYWVAEHHNMPGHRQLVARRSDQAHIADATSLMRVGSGGVMLPNHAPLVVADSSACSKPFTPGGSTWASGARPAPID
jgi:alkanesulfonate monooxygenase SsuD/methylene tetrahydromethanopterin reductase-like flavin-dependent oxidoreductase (luciferase family)